MSEQTFTELVPAAHGEMALANTSALELTIAGAVEAQVRASVQARYTLAINRPRDWDTVRVNLLKECKRPRFAEVARYKKPQGRTAIEGFSIRFVEAALRCMTNIYIETTVIYDDAKRRIVRVSVTDLESNLTPAQDITITKEVERSSADGREVNKVRQNKQGRAVYIVEATDDELLMKQNSLISKTKRSLGLSILPGDIVDEALEVILKTQQERDKQDPEAQKKRLYDSFAEFSIAPSEIKEYLGHEVTPSDLAGLRALYQGIKAGEVRWHEVLADVRNGKETNGLTEQLAQAAAKSKAQKTAPVDQKEPDLDTAYGKAPGEQQ